MEALDQYMLRQTCAFAADVRSSYDEFAFHKIYHRVNHFCIVDLSAFYFDVLKDRLYISAPKSQARRSAQTAIWRIGEALARLLAPIMSFTCEEIWQYLPKMASRSESVHLAQFPTTAEILGSTSIAATDSKSDEEWASLRSVRDRSLEGLGRSSQQQTDRHGARGPGCDYCFGPDVLALATLRRAASISVHCFCGHADPRLWQRD